MANSVIVIPLYNPTQLNYNIIKSYEKLDRQLFDIIVVDNISIVTEYVDEIKKLDFIKYELSEFNGGYETGALYQVYRKTNYDNYFLVQDSIQIKSFGFFETYSLYYSESALAFSPIHRSIERLYLENNIPNPHIEEILSIGKKSNGIMCNAFGIKKYLLKRIFDSNIFSLNVIPKTKKDSMAWESAWAVYFDHFNIPIEFLNPEESLECRHYKKINQNRQ
jgi:hypothetical protein